ncbi:MAG: immunoglobulin domain-containing protein [Verrucomicrobia bacterium]|nr:immunoglobulin domain-containing protein [Verrucomicrobiota bacterium]
MRPSAAPVNLRVVLRLLAALFFGFVALVDCLAASGPSTTITSVDRSVLGPQQPVIITGTNFTGVTSVKIAGIETGFFSVSSDTSIFAVAPPSGWTSGVVSVTASGGTATSAFTVSFTSPSIIGSLTNATVPAGGTTTFSVANNVWGTGTLNYQWKKDGVALSDAAGNIYGANSATLLLTDLQASNATSGAGYTVVVTDSGSPGTATSSAATLTVTSLSSANAFASRLALTGAQASATGTNVGATKEASEPNHAGNAGGASLWATWTAPTSGVVAVDTIGSGFNTLLGVYTGTVVSALTTVASDDDSGPGGTSKLSFNAVAGTVYQIAVDGFGGATGAVRLNLSYAYSFNAFAGSGAFGHLDGTGVAAQFRQPAGVALDSAGNLYVADLDDHVVRKITPAGVVTTFAGQPGNFSPSQDGTGTAARIPQPAGIAVDASDNVYVVELGNGAPGKLRKITPAGAVSTLASGFNQPWSVAVDSAGNAYVTDSSDYTIKKVTPAGLVTTIAGISGVSGDTDGPLGTATFLGPVAIAIDRSGNLFVATGSQTIRKITPAGIVSTVAGSPGVYGSTDGAGSAARFDSPYGFAFDSQGNLYMAERGLVAAGHTIRRMTPGGVVTTIAGSPGVGGSTNGVGGAARFREPIGVAVDSTTGAIYVGDAVDHKVRKGVPANLPQIDTPPLTQTVIAGVNVTLSVSATSLMPLTYQWQKGGVDVSGATSASLALNFVQATDTGNYTVIVTNAVGSVTSAIAALTVNLPPAPVVSSISLATVSSGNVVTLGGANFTGATRVSFNGLAAAYTVVSANSITATVPLGVTSGAVTVTTIGGTSSPTVTYSAVVTPVVQTLYVATGAGGASGKLYRVNPATAAVTLIGSLSLGGASSLSVTGLAFHPTTGVLYGVTGNESGPTRKLVIIDPTSGSASIAGTLTVGSSDIAFDVNGTLYTWKTQGGPLGTVNLATGAVTAVGTATNGSQGNGLAFTPDGTLYVAGPTSGVLAKVNPSTGALTTVASLTGAPVVGWGPINAMASNANGVLYAVAADNPGTLVTINPVTAAMTTVGSLGINDVDAIAFSITPQPPTITTQPVAAAAGTVGAGVTLTVAATGTSALTYQWRKYGQALAGATNATLTLSSLTLFDAGFYDVGVTANGVGAASTVSRVTVNPGASVPSVVTASSTFAPQIESGYSYLNRIQRSADGKVYVAGYFSSFAGTPRPRYARLNSDGSLDLTFVPAPLSLADDPFDGYVHAVAPLADGRVLIAGEFDTVGGYPRRTIARLNSDGSVDASFNSPYDFEGGHIKAMVLQTDGKIVVAGGFRNKNLVRLNADGSEDATFAGLAFDGEVKTLVLQADGKIVAGGSFSSYGVVNTSRIARLTTTGALDTAYNTAISVGPDSTVETLVLQGDGRLLVGGAFANFGGTLHPRLVRLLETGALDTTFLTGSGFDGPVYQLALPGDGTIYAAGDFSAFDGTTSRGLVRLLAAGGRDPAFSTGTDSDAGFDDGADGVALLSTGAVLVVNNDSSRYNSATTNLSGPVARIGSTGVLDATYLPAPRSPGQVRAIVPAPGGKWYVGGDFAFVNGLARCNLARLNADGTTDIAFAIPGSGFSSDVYALAVQPDGKVIVGGRFTALDGATAHGLLRLDATGTRDATFDSVYNFQNDVYALALQADGRILVAGSENYSPGSNPSLVRLRTDGTRDVTFALPGSAINGDVNALVVLPDGDVYVGGSFSSIGSVAANGIARLNADGTRDTGFAVGTGFGGYVYALALQPDGKLVVGGDFSTYQGVATGNVARLDAAGVRDTAFAATEFVDGSVAALALQADGKIFAAGDFSSYGFSTSLDIPHVARLNANGTIDTSFSSPTLLADPSALQLTGSGGLLVAGGALGFPARMSTGLALLESAALPGITTSPSNQVASIGGTATFTVVATGFNPTYQWFKDGVPIAGARTPSLTITSAQITDAAAYSVQVSNVFGSVLSGNALLTGPGAAPTITGQPVSVSVAVGDTATLTVTATGATNYQWRKLGVAIPSATNATFTSPGANFGGTAMYDVLVGNGLSVTRSAAARLTVVARGSVQNPLRPDRSFAAIFESAGSYGAPSRILAHTDGSYYVTGEFTSVDGAIRLGVARFSAAGVLDPAFAPEVGGGPINALARQADGKLLIAGDFHRVNGVECNHLARLNTDGTLDTGFLMGSGTYDSLYAVAVQADGKIVIGGDITSYNGTSSLHGLVRLNADGTLDTAFRTALGSGFDSTVRGVAIHSDNRIFVVGGFTSFNGSNTANHLVALNPDGTRSALAGLTASSFDGGSSLSAIVVQPDGKIIVGGSFTTFAGNATRHLARLNTDGSYDSGFATNVGASSSITSIVRQSDGQVYVTGNFNSFGGHTVRVVLVSTAGAYVRGYYFDGSPGGLALGAADALLVVGDFQTYYSADLTSNAPRSRFARIDSAGVISSSQVLRWGSAEGTVNTIVAAPGGKWLVGGYFDRVGGTLIHNLARLNADGTIDGTFSPAESPLFDEVKAIAVQGDGKILVGGAFAHYGTESSYASVGRLIRLNADGTRDSTFSLGSGFDNEVTALAVQADGRILVGGDFEMLNDRSVSPRLVRLFSDGTRDTSFLTGTGLDSEPRAIVVQADGKILVGGTFSRYNSAVTNARRLIRLLSTGALELSYEVSGGDVNALVLQPSGDLLVGGDYSSIAGQARCSLARVSAAGVFDAAFNTGNIFFDGESPGYITSLALQADGKVIVGGYFSDLSAVQGTGQLARLTSAGALDPTFVANLFTQPAALAVRADGGLLVAGGSHDFNTTYRHGLIAVTGSTSSAPTITTPPVAQSAVFGGTATFTVVAAGTPTPTFQWQRNSTNIPGATNATYTITSASQANAGLYRVVVTNAGGSVTSTPVSFDVVTRNLINFYGSAVVASGGSIVSSFTVEGSLPKSVLLIGVGGARANAGNATGALADPRLTLTDATGTSLGVNNDWGSAANVAAITTAATQVAATPGLTPTGEGARDAAMLVTLTPGTYHVKLDGADAGGGAAILQIYDADTDSRPRLVMFTLRANVASGANQDPAAPRARRIAGRFGRGVG